MSRAELLFERMKQRMKYVYPVYNGYLCETADKWNVRRTAEGLMFQRTKGHYCRMALKMSEIRLRICYWQHCCMISSRMC